MTKLIFLVSILWLATAHATHVAITDSGTDFSHQWLIGHEWFNEGEIPGNLVDDDKNKKVDDVVGWNFIDGYGKIFFPDHLTSIDPKLFKYFDVLSRIQSKTQTPEDQQFWKENVTQLSPEQKKNLLTSLNFYGQYAHGTHVAGIIASLSPQSKLMANRIFQDTPPDRRSRSLRGITDWFFQIMAVASNGVFEQIANYLKERHADLANYSLGMNLQTFAKLSLGVKGNVKPSAEQLSFETKRVAVQFEKVGRRWMSVSSGTLFVIAAGNDGTDNDQFPFFPANVRIENSITVAASYGRWKLADFSNYGETSVDIAAPGVAIVSSVPSLDHQQTLPLSGTSMAAPYITGVAAKMKEINGLLNPQDLKFILMGTVDKKEWLAKKVISSGVVNEERAYYAAKEALNHSLVEAVESAKMNVKDVEVPPMPSLLTRWSEEQDEMQAIAQQMVF